VLFFQLAYNFFFEFVHKQPYTCSDTDCCNVSHLAPYIRCFLLSFESFRVGVGTTCGTKVPKNAVAPWCHGANVKLGTGASTWRRGHRCQCEIRHRCQHWLNRAPVPMKILAPWWCAFASSLVPVEASCWKCLRCHFEGWHRVASLSFGPNE